MAVPRPAKVTRRLSARREALRIRAASDGFRVKMRDGTDDRLCCAIFAPGKRGAASLDR
jgi:hypothetical protein